MAASNEVAVRFTASIEGLISGLARARSAIEGFTSSVKSSLDGLVSPFRKLNEAIVAIGAIAAGGAIFKSFIDATVDATTETTKLAQVLGVSREKASIWRSELKAVGIPVDEFADDILKLDRAVKTHGDDLVKLGIQIKDTTTGAYLPQEQILSNTITRLGQMEAGTQRNIVSQYAFGRAVGNSNALFKLTSEAMQRAAKDTAELHLFSDDEDRRKVGQYKVAINQMSLAFEGLRNAIGTQLMPYLTTFAKWFRAEAPDAIAGMQGKLQEAINKVFDWILATAEFTVTLKFNLNELGITLDEIISKLKILSYTTPYPYIINAVSLIGTGFSKLNDLLSNNKKAQEEGGETTKKTLEEELAAVKALIEGYRAKALAAGQVPPGGPPPPPEGKDKAPDLAGQKKATEEAQKEIDRRIKMIGLEQERELAIIDQNVAMFGLSESQKSEMVRNRLDQTYQEELAELEKKKAIGGLEVAERKKIEDQILELKMKTGTKLIQMQTAEFEALKAKWVEFFSTITGSFNGQLRGLLAGTTKFRDAFKTILGDMIIALIQWGEKAVVEWAAIELSKQGISLASIATISAAQTTATAASMGEAIANAIKFIATSAGRVIAGVTAFLAPYLGPLALPAGITAGGAMTAAATGGMPKAEAGWWNVGMTTPTLLHAGEMVIPKPFAEDLRDSGGGGFGGATHLHFPGIMDSGAFLNAVKNNASPIARMIAKAMTQNPSLRPAY